MILYHCYTTDGTFKIMSTYNHSLYGPAFPCILTLSPLKFRVLFGTCLYYRSATHAQLGDNLGASIGMADERMCFFCDRKPRAYGDVACRSCLQEHRKCYECGENDRNFPFKLCTSCYTAHLRSSGVQNVPPTVSFQSREGG